MTCKAKLELSSSPAAAVSLATCLPPRPALPSISALDAVPGLGTVTLDMSDSYRLNSPKNKVLSRHRKNRRESCIRFQCIARLQVVEISVSSVCHPGPIAGL